MCTSGYINKTSSCKFKPLDHGGTLEEFIFTGYLLNITDYQLKVKQISTIFILKSKITFTPVIPNLLLETVADCNTVCSTLFRSVSTRKSAVTISVQG